MVSDAHSACERARARARAQKIMKALRGGRRRSSVERETIRDARRGLQMLLRAAAKFRVFLKRVRARKAAEAAEAAAAPGGRAAPARRARTLLRQTADADGGGGGSERGGDARAPPTAQPQAAAAAARPQSAAATSGRARSDSPADKGPGGGGSWRANRPRTSQVRLRRTAVPGTVVRPPAWALRARFGPGEAPTGPPAAYGALARAGREGAGGGARAGAHAAIARAAAFVWAPAAS